MESRIFSARFCLTSTVDGVIIQGKIDCKSSRGTKLIHVVSNMKYV